MGIKLKLAIKVRSKETEDLKDVERNKSANSSLRFARVVKVLHYSVNEEAIVLDT